MDLTLYICIGLVFLFILVGVVWRISSRRSSVPCPAWLAWLVELENPFGGNYKARSIIDQLELRSGMTALDAGCGPGRITIPLAQRVGPEGEVTAIDIQPAMLRRAENKARTAGVANIRFLQIGLGEGKLQDNWYDRALLVTVLGEIPDRQRALQEIFEALKPGGLLSISEIIFDPHYQSRGAIVRLGTPCGFRERSFYGNRLSFTVILEKPVVE
jgi:SAM-dependent methyltransferase